MRSRVKLLASVIVLFIAIAALTIRARGTQSTPPAYAAPGKSLMGADAADKMTDSWATNHKLLAGYEQAQSKLRAEVIKRRRLYQDGEISRAAVQEAERSFVGVLMRIQEVRRLMTENEIAIAETEMKDDATLGINGFNETNSLSRFSGGAHWSVKDASSLERYFHKTFGHNLPVSALGQTATHDRMRFDHRDAIDVALHPDSPEGKALIDHLRRSGIPFIAFRNAAAGASTGAHIHIGRPSHRIAAAR